MAGRTQHSTFLLGLDFDQLLIQDVPLRHGVDDAVVHVRAEHVLLRVWVQADAVVVGVARFVLLELVEVGALRGDCAQPVVLLLRA